MAVIDLWVGRNGQPTKRHGQGRRYRVVVDGHPTKSFDGSRAATEWEKTLVRRGQLPPASTVTIGDLIDIFLDTKRGLSKGGYQALQAGGKHVREKWAKTTVGDIQKHQIEAWLGRLKVVVGTKAAPRKEDASHATKVKALSVLRGCLAIAVERGDISINPAIGASVGRKPSIEPVFITVKELGRLAAETGRYAAMIWVLGTCGLRLGEACALTVADVSAERCRIRVKASTAKSGKGRDVPVPKTVMAMLTLNGKKTDPLFMTAYGKPIDIDNWRRRVFVPAVERALPGQHFTPHDLRHTAASLMIASGATVKDVQAALGHASAKMTLDVYAGLFDAGLDDVAERMDVLLK